MPGLQGVLRESPLILEGFAGNRNVQGVTIYSAAGKAQITWGHRSPSSHFSLVWGTCLLENGQFREDLNLLGILVEVSSVGLCLVLHGQWAEKRSLPLRLGSRGDLFLAGLLVKASQSQILELQRAGWNHDLVLQRRWENGVGGGQVERLMWSEPHLWARHQDTHFPNCHFMENVMP